MRKHKPVKAVGPASSRMYSVFRHNQSRHTTPLMVVDRATRDCLVEYHNAFPLSRWVIVLKEPLPLKLRDTSCSIRESTIMAAASGSKYHLSLIQEAWG